jgi:hypothetical protein
VKLAMDEGKAEKNAAASAKAGKTEKLGFFAKLKGIFKKKPKLKTVVPDSTAVGDQEISPSDSSATTTPQPTVKKKKGLFGKKPKAAPPVAPKKKADAKKEENDGF